MTRKPTIRDVAKLAKVSMGTVSRVCANSAPVKADTRQRVQTAMQQLGYVPNIAARTMRTQRTMMVGLLVPSFSNPLFSKVAKAAVQALSPAGYSLFLHSSERDAASEISFFGLAAQHQMDGVIVSLSDETNEQVATALTRYGGPVVILDRDIDVDRDVVFSEHADAMRRATKHLIALGHTRIALIAAPKTIRPGRERLRAFDETMRAANIEVPSELIRCAYQSSQYGYNQTHELMSSRAPPTAIIAAGNDLMHGVLKAVRTLGLAVPQDLSIIGADYPELAEIMTPPVTIIYRDMDLVGETAARLLLTRMTSRDSIIPTSRLHLPSDILLRESTGAPRGALGTTKEDDDELAV